MAWYRSFVAGSTTPDGKRRSSGCAWLLGLPRLRSGPLQLLRRLALLLERPWCPLQMFRIGALEPPIRLLWSGLPFSRRNQSCLHYVCGPAFSSELRNPAGGAGCLLCAV
ncbi:hypothetical protein HPB52_011603 [Rhipicephalus sanguineus]|uniref:Uncharacterized protein n=1 Tax=Rhipicephalus sanguineus TaxID=34632 RepID=A0A9D4PZM1_RHISA|nr:hypothetical protein HPB52_011603 [Rhipicephalus sanguineus]